MQGGKTQTMEKLQHAVVVDVAELAKSMRKELEDMERSRLQKWRRPTIHRVFPRLREGDITAYDPKVISIGPFHRENPALRAMEVHKWRYLHDLLARSPVNKLEKCVAEVGLRVEEIRAQYSDKFEDITDVDFVKMMVMDGCFILELLVKLGSGNKDGTLPATMQWVLNHLWMDLFLLENQIPYFVLETLFEALAPRPFGFTLMQLALLIMSGGEVISLPEGFPASGPFLHLLHLWHSLCVSQPPREEPYSCRKATLHKLRKTRKVASYVAYLLMSCVTCNLSLCSTDDGQQKRVKQIEQSSLTIPCATQLKEAGIRFEARDSCKKGKLDMWMQVTFSDGTLEMPRVHLSDLSNALLRNLIAFELCYPENGKYYYTSFAYLMDRLVDTEKDVELLVDCGIVFNALGSGQEAAAFFNKLYKGANFDIYHQHFGDLFNDVNKYCKSGHHGWRAKLMHDYFGNPWSVISLVAAAVLLVLTIVQTIYTVKSYYSSAPGS